MGQAFAPFNLHVCRRRMTQTIAPAPVKRHAHTPAPDTSSAPAHLCCLGFEGLHVIEQLEVSS